MARLRGRSDLLAAQQAAAYLNVSTTRLRDMVAEGKLNPIRVDRFSVYPRAELERYALTRAGGRATPVGDLLDAPPQPLERRLDQVIRISQPYDAAHAAHVRIFKGPASDGSARTVVVIGGVTDELSMIIARWEQIVASVDAEFLQGEGINAVWFAQEWTDLDGIEINNVVMMRRPRPVTAVRRFLTGRRPDPADEKDFDDEPNFWSTSVEEIERIIGGPLEIYPRPAYTERSIRRWQMLGHQIDVEDDRAGIRPLLTALEKFDGSNALRAQEACQELAREVVVLSDEMDRLPWNDGTSPRFEGQKASWPKHFAARLIKPQLSSHQQKLIARHDKGESWPWTAEYLADYQQRMLDLRDWREQVDEFAEAPDRDLAEALSVVIGVMAHWIGVARHTQPADTDAELKPGPPEDPYPGSTPRLFTTGGDYDRRYLSTITWESGHEPVNREHRRIAAELGSMYRDHPEQWRFGVDRFDHAVAHREPTDDLRDDWLAVCWPHTTPQRLVLDGAIIVADGAGPGRAGARPAYIQYPDQALDLLPSRRNDPGWSFGYGGGSPGRLCSAITDLIQRVDKVRRDDIPESWIDDAVHHSDPAQLNIAVDDIRRRIKHS